jgi:hypothetical protein
MNILKKKYVYYRLHKAWVRNIKKQKACTDRYRMEIYELREVQQKLEEKMKALGA